MASLAQVLESGPVHPKCTGIDLQDETPGPIVVMFVSAIFCMKLIR